MGEIENKKKLFFGLAGVIVLVVLVGWVVFGRAKNSEAVMERAVEQLQQTVGVHADVKLLINLPERMRSQKRPLTKVTIDVKGDVTRGEQALGMAGNMSLEARGPGNIFFSEGEVKVFEDEVAFKLSEFPVLLNPSGSLSGKWTYVPTQILGLKNGGQDLAVLSGLGKNLVYQGKEIIGSDRTWYFSGTLSDETSQQMQAAWQVSSSGNKGLDVVARLLKANRVKQVEVWVATKDSQLRRIKVNFVRPLKNGNEFDFATLDVTLSDYGRVAVAERPVKELTVRPDVFAKIFGTGEIQEIKTE